MSVRASRAGDFERQNEQALEAVPKFSADSVDVVGSVYKQKLRNDTTDIAQTPRWRRAVKIMASIHHTSAYRLG